jgi:hypothetical protein
LSETEGWNEAHWNLFQDVFKNNPDILNFVNQANKAVDDS